MLLSKHNIDFRMLHCTILLVLAIVRTSTQAMISSVLSSVETILRIDWVNYGVQRVHFPDEVYIHFKGTQHTAKWSYGSFFQTELRVKTYSKSLFIITREI